MPHEVKYWVLVPSQLQLAFRMKFKAPWHGPCVATLRAAMTAVLSLELLLFLLRSTACKRMQSNYEMMSLRLHKLPGQGATAKHFFGRWKF